MSQNLNNASTSIIESKKAKFLGLDVKFPVFLISSGLATLFSCLVLILPEASNTFLSSSRQFVVSRFDTLFTVSMLSFTFIILFLIVSPLEKLNLVERIHLQNLVSYHGFACYSQQVWV